jgi:hypothetical protein
MEKKVKKPTWLAADECILHPNLEDSLQVEIKMV